MMKINTRAEHVCRKLWYYLADDCSFWDSTLNFLQHRIMERFYIRGNINALVVGSAGGTETYKLCSLGNNVTAVEFNEAAKVGIEVRLSRHNLEENCSVAVGGIESFTPGRSFQFILMSHVLEHIDDDYGVLEKIAKHSATHARLIIATPTSLSGQKSKRDCVYSEANGPNHVRVGYQGPELDRMLEKMDFVLLTRTYLGNPVCKFIWNLEPNQKSRVVSAGCFFLRPFVALLAVFRWRPYVQISIYTKVPASGASANLADNVK